MGEIKKRTFGRTGVAVTELGFGGIPIMGVSMEEAVKIAHRSLDLGINYIDTARAYADSEAKIGEVMKTRRGECFLATKTHFYSKKEAEEALATSLKELKTDVIDLYQIHDLSSRDRYDKAMGPDGAMEAILKARDDGKIRFIGVTGHNISLLMEAIETGLFDSILCVYNLAVSDTADRLIPRAHALNLGVAIMKPLSGGALFSLSQGQITPYDALRFVLSNPHISTALGGPKSLEDVEQNVKIAHAYEIMKEEESQKLKALAEAIGDKVCKNCRYCDLCPEHIPVPEIMQLWDHSQVFGYEWPKHRKTYAAFPVKADACVDCGDCEEKCPFKLPIRERLQKAHQRFNLPV